MMRHHDQKQTWGGKDLFQLLSYITVCHQGQSGQELKRKAGADAEARKELLTDLLLMVCSAFHIAAHEVRCPQRAGHFHITN